MRQYSRRAVPCARSPQFLVRAGLVLALFASMIAIPTSAAPDTVGIDEDAFQIGAPLRGSGRSISRVGLVATCAAPCIEPATVSLTAYPRPANGRAVQNIQFLRDGTSLGNASQAPYQAQAAGLTAGTYSFTAVLADNLGGQSTSPAQAVTVLVHSAPAITVFSATATCSLPCNGTGTVTLTANASAMPGLAISRIKFEDVAGTTPTLPQTITTAGSATISLSSVPAGPHRYRATAYDARDKPSLPSEATVEVPLAPSITSASAKTFFVGQSGTFTIATPGYPAPTVTLSGCALPATLGLTGNTLSGTPTVTGTYSCVLTAQNPHGSATQNFTLTVSRNDPPTIVFKSDTDATGLVGMPILLAATASDPDQSSLNVQFIDAATSQVIAAGIQSGNDYSANWVPATPGFYTILARATDNAGATAQASRSITVLGSATPNAESVAPQGYTTPTIGTTAGTFAVSDSGAATYTIPIQVPPGTGGMQPALALSYNSQGGYGPLGVGWNLSGLSAITRCPNTYAQDAKKIGINYDTDASNDNYCLDGVRLIEVARRPVPQALNDPLALSVFEIEFRTELESYSRIVGYSESTNPATSKYVIGPNRFRVWTKSGQIMDYGSKYWILSHGWYLNVYGRRNTAKAWVLDRVADRSGNYLTVDYGGDVFVLISRLAADVPASLAQPVGAFPNVEYRPINIKYYPAGIPESTPGGYNEIQFVYSDLAEADRQRFYDSGAGSATLQKLLVRVDTYASGAAARSYRLEYQKGATDRYRLQHVRECAADGSCLANPTTFTWTESAKTFSAPVGTFFEVRDKDPRPRVADLNGDGRPDLVFKQSWTDEFSGLAKARWTACFSEGGAFACGGTAGPYQSFVLEPTEPELIAAEWHLADVDGDGRADLVLRATNYLRVCHTGSGSWSCVNASTASTGHPGTLMLQGDLDGDGRIDYFYSQGNNQWTTCLSKGTRDESNYACNTHAPLTPHCNAEDPAELCSPPADDPIAWAQYFAGDFNGDGKVDLIQRKVPYNPNGPNTADTEYWRVCYSDFGENGTNAFQCHKGWLRGVNGELQNITVLDFNGDGLADMATRRPLANSWAGLGIDDQYRWQICLSVGDGAFEFFDPKIHPDDREEGTGKYVDAAGNPIEDPYSAHRCRAWSGVSSDSESTIYGDFNGDGRTDLLNAENRGNGLRWWVCRSTGNAFACEDWGPVAPDIDRGQRNENVYTGDFDGDGRTDMLVRLKNGTWSVITAGNGSPFGDLLSTVTTGFGATTQVTYAPITDASVYKKGTGADTTQHEIDIQSPLYVVKKTQASNGNGGTFDTDYFYEGLRGRTDGRGLFGFAKKRSRDSSGIVSETEYSRIAAATYSSSWPLVGRPIAERKFATIGAGYDLAATPEGQSSLVRVSRTTTTWDSRPSGTYACQWGPCLPTPREVFATAVVQEGWDLNGAVMPWSSTTTPLESIDIYGNPQTVIVSTSDGFAKTTTSQYTNDPATWILGRLLRARVTATAGASGSTRVSAFTYQGYEDSCNGAPGVLCSETIEPDSPSSPLWQQTRYAYGPFGNKIQVTLLFHDPSLGQVSRSSYTSFDSLGRFPWVVQNAKGQTETRTFDARFGVPLTVTDTNGTVTTTNLDGFGRKYLETVTDSAGNRLAQSFITVEAAGLQGAERYRLLTRSSGGGEARSYFDALQRERRVQTKGFATDTWVEATTSYDAVGRKHQIAKPAGGGTTTTTYGYDPLSRIATEQTSGGAINRSTAVSYNGLTTSVTVSGSGISSRTTSKTLNSQGQTLNVVDANYKTTTYTYDAFGNLLSVSGPTGIAEAMSYDTRGRKITLANPDSGSWQYQYNGAGELVRQTDGKGQVTRQFYDALGRMVERREHAGADTAPAFVTVWSHDAYADGSACNKGAGKLCEVRSATISGRTAIGGALPLDPADGNSPVRRLTRYDAAGRPTQHLTEIAELVTGQPRTKRFLTTQAFDANSRVEATAHPSGLTLKNGYTSWSGQLNQLSEAESGSVHWLANSRHADGQIASMQLGNLTTTKTYDGFGRPATAATGGLQNASYAFDALGNLTSRGDSAASQAPQSFGYDALNRLVMQDGATAATYDDAGNLLARAGGGYSYFAGTHRVQSAGGYSLAYDSNGNVTQINGGAGKTLTYLPFNLPSRIAAGANTLDYLYDGAHARIKETSTTAQGVATTWYLGAYEEHSRPDGVLEQRHFLNTPEGAVGVLTRRSNGLNGVRYWHKDALGSIVATSDPAGGTLQRFAYDAWGARTPTGNTDAEERGYTGHEHLGEVGLIHMNGRLYFEGIGRFLQADPFIQAPYDGQNYNRYSYVMNNPLSLTDPSGYFFGVDDFFIAVAIIAGARATNIIDTRTARSLLGMAVAMFVGPSGHFGASGGLFGSPLASTIAGGFAAGGLAGGNIQSAVQGAFFAAAFYGVGDWSGAHAAGDSLAFGSPVHLAQTAGHAVVGCAQAAAAGGSCGRGALSAGFAAYAGPLLPGEPRSVARLVATVVAGGTASTLGGGKFANGAVTAAFGYLFNSLARPRNTVEAKIQQALMQGDAAELRLALGEAGSEVSVSDIAMAQRALGAMENLSPESAKMLAERYGLDFANKIGHAFGKEMHNLDGLVQTYGSAERAFVQVQAQVDSLSLSAGQFQQVVSVGGINVTVRGFVQNGVAKIATIFKP